MIIFFILLIVNIVYDMNLVCENMYTSLYIWLIKVFPTFFIFYIFSSFLLQKNILSKLSVFLKPFFSFESNKTYELLLLSFFISNPSTIKHSKKAYEENKITLKDYKKIIYLSLFSNPLFLLSFLNIKTVLIFILIQFITIFIIDKFMKLNKEDNTIINNSLKENSFIILNTSLNDSIHILLMIAVSICFINLIKFSIINTLNIINININSLDLYLSIFEVTSGIISIQSLTLPYENVLIIFLVTFQGLAINLQNYCVINDSKINYKKAIIIRFIESLIASIIYLLLIYIATSLLP